MNTEIKINAAKDFKINLKKDFRIVLKDELDFFIMIREPGRNRFRPTDDNAEFFLIRATIL